MTGRLLDRSRQATVRQYQQVVTTREQRAPRILIIGVVGLIGWSDSACWPCRS